MPLFGPPDISKLKDKRDIKGLNNALKDRDPNIVRDAAFALADLGIYASIGLLVGLSSPEWKIRRIAYLSFAKFKGFGFIPLLASLHDEQEMIRLSGLLGLMLLDDKRAVQPIGDCLLHDASKNVRSSAAAALFKLGGHQALEYLLTARSDLDPEVKSAVENVLAKIEH
jgi:HEAT repeat protein